MNARIVPMAAAMALLVAGCAGLPMGVTSQTPALDVGAQSLVLLSVELANGRVPPCVPQAEAVLVESADGDELEFESDGEGVVENRVERNYNRYLLRLALAPGRYTIRGIGGTCEAFGLTGKYFMPLQAPLEVAAGRVLYVGRVTGVVRARREGERRAGSAIPVIPQAASGFSGGTWDVVISDASADDLARMNEVFPALRTAQVEKQILPPPDRHEARK